MPGRRRRLSVMRNLLNLTYPELETLMTQELGEPKFRAAQVWQWIWQQGVTSFDDMTNISRAARERLTEMACIRLPEIVTEQVSEDGTRKFLLRLEDGELIETVLIPGEERAGLVRLTQCLSCQVGCAMGCTFCSTGDMGFVRNMTAGEILGQIMVAKQAVGDNRLDHPMIRNLVFMGMGEPLLNLNEVLRSLHMLNNPKGLNFSPRRITVSTCGLAQGLRELGDSGLAFLAVSLHAPDQELRARIMPRAARWPLDDLVTALAGYPLKTREKITLEYLLLGGVNDSPAHARSLAKIVSRINGKLNLIAYNPPAGDESTRAATSRYTAPSPEAVMAFQKILWDKRITAILRKSKGQDIKAACGQLRTACQDRGAVGLSDTAFQAINHCAPTRESGGTVNAPGLESGEYIS